MPIGIFQSRRLGEYCKDGIYSIHHMINHNPGEPWARDILCLCDVDNQK